ncbi:hypothetical protein ABFS83_08G033800 [Erythranthe nasuta]
MGALLTVSVLLFCATFSWTGAYDSIDPNGDITITWDILAWTGDGYTAYVTITNFQKFRHVEAPGWTLGWTWAKKEVIWTMTRGETIEQGDCSSFIGSNIPHCCKKDPAVVDLLPGTPYNQQTANCCTGGIIGAFVQDPAHSATIFQLSVGNSGNSNTTVKPPKNFTLTAPGPGYTCGPAEVASPTRFITQDGRRATQAMMTWKIMCTYSQFVARKTPSCCVSLSAFYSPEIVPCPTCSCGCMNITQPGSCVDPSSPNAESIVSGRQKSNNSTPLVQCTSFMCPIRVHWHVKQSYKGFWRVKVTISNFNYVRNYTDWNLFVQHPNFDNITEVFSFNYKLMNYVDINDSAIFWGVKSFNDFLNQAGPLGNLQSEILLRKGPTFSFEDGWAFPRVISFNGDSCVMPPPDSYPKLPKGSSSSGEIIFIIILVMLPLLAVGLFQLVVFILRKYKKMKQ